MRAIIPEAGRQAMKRLVLAGGGHAHLSVLEAFAKKRAADTELVLVTPSRYQYYSGMLPGWMAGHYREEDCRIDLAPWAERAGARLVLTELVGIDAQARCAVVEGGARLPYDWLSLDVGSSVDFQGLDALGAAFLPAKPLADFFTCWPQVLADARAAEAYSLAVVGAGAAGVELVLAAAYALRGSNSRVHLVGSDASFLADHAPAVRRRALAKLREAGVQWHAQRAGAVVAPKPGALGQEQGAIALSNGSILRCDTLIAATGATALGWLADTGLACDERGFVAVNAQHQSTSHPHVFAVGDCCARVDTAMQRSGVHAVRAGPVLAHNLRAALVGDALQTYRPRKRSLYLLACGPRYAVASWGSFSAEGAWVWRWKNHLDQGFVRRFSGGA
ncbi:MAG: FAD-dependent oxidoreductase [Giesbergeria sp.]